MPPSAMPAPVPADDRGLNYGDGLFETMAVSGGRIRLRDLHMSRLGAGCGRLGLTLALSALAPELDARADLLGEGVIKLVVTRGSGPRGYRPPDGARVRYRIFTSADAPGFGEGSALRVMTCRTPLGLNPALAGLKHLNRLEQVMASAELSGQDGAPAFDEGLMLDIEGNVVCATAANLFVAEGARLLTPAIDRAGVEGVMRRALITCAGRLGLTVEQARMRPQRLHSGAELMLTSAVRGLQSVASLDGQSLAVGPAAAELRAALRELCAEPGS